MASHSGRSVFLLIISSLIFFQSKADGTASVFFIDGKDHSYVRSPSPNHVTETDSLLLSEVGAAVSVLLGFAPPASLSAASSSKLNEVLLPNPFDRPQNVLMLDVVGVEDFNLGVESNDIFNNALRRKVVFGEDKSGIPLSDEDKLSTVSLNEPSSGGTDAEYTDKELSDFASWLGGSYVANGLEQLTGELTISLANGAHLNLKMTKEADRRFTTSLVSLIRNIRRAMDLHQDLSATMHKPAELIMGKFDGIEVLKEQYGVEGVAEQGLELLVAAISKVFDSVKAAYKGEIVGVIFFSNGGKLSESGIMSNVKFTSRSSPRLLQEKESSSNSTLIQEVVLVRLTLAWITGIILIIATLLGIYFLVNMPLTRDTLLYSNVKFD